MLDNPRDQIGRLNRQVVQLLQQGHYDRAFGLATQARDLARQHLGEDHLDYVQSLNNLAELYRAMDNYAAAEPLLRQASDICRTALGADLPAGQGRESGPEEGAASASTGEVDRPMKMLDLDLTPPPGSERVFAVWSRRPLPLDQLRSLAGRGEVPGSRPYRATCDIRRV